MVCLMCLIPLFLIPIVNLLPILFDKIMAKVYRLFGWEYRRPERAPPACPIKPSANTSKTNHPKVIGEHNTVAAGSPKDSVSLDDAKQD